MLSQFTRTHSAKAGYQLMAGTQASPIEYIRNRHSIFSACHSSTAFKQAIQRNNWKVSKQKVEDTHNKLSEETNVYWYPLRGSRRGCVDHDTVATIVRVRPSAYCWLRTLYLSLFRLRTLHHLIYTRSLFDALSHVFSLLSADKQCSLPGKPFRLGRNLEGAPFGRLKG